MMRLIGLYREAECSPGAHRSNDTRLLELVGQALEARGFRVDLMRLEDAVDRRQSATMIFSMCQGRAALEALTGWELEGTCLVNSPRAALNTYRDRLPAILHASGIRFPRTKIVTTARIDDPAIDGNGGVWLKRGDVHASVSADVQWTDDPTRAHAERPMLVVDAAGHGLRAEVPELLNDDRAVEELAAASHDRSHVFRIAAVQAQPTQLEAELVVDVFPAVGVHALQRALR